MKHALTGVIVLLLTAAAHASIISMHFEPPVSDPLHSVDAVINGAEGCTIRPNAHTVTRDGSTVRIEFFYPHAGCLSFPSPWHDVVPLGALPAGVYDVVVVATLGTRTSTLQRTLIVRDSGNVQFEHAAVPISGGSIGITDLRCASPDWDKCAESISFGGSIPSPIVRESVTVPPHAAGTVDATVYAFDGSKQTIKAAITYYDPAAPPDLALFEPILFPIAYDGEGAFGSQWTTANVLRLLTPRYATDADLKASRPEGALVWAFRGTTFVDAQSRIRETTRNDMGVEVPVVRERDFRHPTGDFYGDVKILLIPVRANARYTLRIYALGNPGVVSLDHDSIVLSKTNTDGLWFAAVDITDTIVHSYTTPASVGLYQSIAYDVPYWAMVSITDNATQQVSIVSPQ